MTGEMRHVDGLAVVPCEGDDVIALLSLDGTVRGTVSVGSDPVHATAVDGRVFVATMGERSVTAIDDSGEVRRVETGVLGPSHFAVGPGSIGQAESTSCPDLSADVDSPPLLVSCTAGDVVTAIDPETFELLGRIPTGAEPHEIAVAGELVVVGSRADGVVSVVPELRDTKEAAKRRVDVDLGDNARVQGIDTPPSMDGRRTAPTDAGPIFAVDQRGERLVRLTVNDPTDPTSVTIDGTASVGTDPYDVTVMDDRVFVAARESGTVHELDHDLTTISVTDVGGAPENVVIVNGAPLVYFRDTSRLVGLEGDVQVDVPYPVLHATTVPGDHIGNASDDLLLSHYDDDAVSVVDGGDGDVRWTVDTPAQPFGSVIV